jgi:hypothetical protein
MGKVTNLGGVGYEGMTVNQSATGYVGATGHHRLIGNPRISVVGKIIFALNVPTKVAGLDVAEGA